MLKFVALQVQVCERNYQPVDEVTVCWFVYCFFKMIHWQSCIPSTIDCYIFSLNNVVAGSSDHCGTVYWWFYDGYSRSQASRRRNRRSYLFEILGFVFRYQKIFNVHPYLWTSQVCQWVIWTRILSCNFSESQAVSYMYCTFRYIRKWIWHIFAY